MIIERFYNDYLMPSRIQEYDGLLISIIKEGYQIISVIDFFNRLKNGEIKENDRILINRHDIDTDSKTARRFFEVEKKHKIKASYYFRLKTVNISLMQEIQEYGSEASYHFEELASYAKRNKFKNEIEVKSKIDEIRFDFKDNFLTLEKKLGYKLSTVASHGDFANRNLGIANNVITDSKELRKQLGIVCEAYDYELLDTFDIYLSDRAPPVKFVPMTPLEAINSGHKIISMLTHPRQWHASWLENSKENLVRAVEGWKWK